jgi:hypothetical protein
MRRSAPHNSTCKHPPFDPNPQNGLEMDERTPATRDRARAPSRDQSSPTAETNRPASPHSRTTRNSASRPRSRRNSSVSGERPRYAKRRPKGRSTRIGRPKRLDIALAMAPAPLAFRFPMNRVTRALSAPCRRSRPQRARAPEIAGTVDKPGIRAVPASRAAASSLVSSRSGTTQSTSSLMSTQCAPARTAAVGSSGESSWNGPAAQATATQPRAVRIKESGSPRSSAIGDVRSGVPSSRQAA